MDTSRPPKTVFSSNWKAFFLLMAMVLWFNHELLWTDKVPFFRDLGPYFYPIRWSLAQSFRSGELPLWDRHMAMGFPLLADFQSGVFYPPHFFYLILPFFTAVKASFLFHYAVVAAGVYVLCLRWGYSISIALMGSIIFTFGGVMISLSNLLNHFQAAVWLPWVIWSGEKCFQQPSAKNFWLLTGVLLLQFLAGSPEIYTMNMALLLLDGLRITGVSGRSGFCRILWVFLGSNALVIALSMAQILPTSELFLESRARRTISYQDSTEWSLRPLSLLNVLFLDKEVSFDASNGLRLFFTQDLPLNISLYLGAMAIPGLGLWLWHSSLREKAALLALILLTLALSMGGHTPLHALLFRYVPFFGLFRFPEKFVFFTYAFVVFAMVRGLNVFFHDDGFLSSRSLFFLSLIVLVVLLFYLGLRFDTEPLSRFVSQTARLPHLSTPVLATTSAVLVNFERQMALAAGVVFLLVLVRIRKSKATLFQGLLLALIFVDLDSAHRPYQYLLSPKFVFNGSRILSSPDLYRVFHYTGASDLHPSFYRISRRLTFDELQATVFSNLAPNTGVFHGVDYMQEIDALGRWPYVVFLNFMNKTAPEGQYRVLRALNVKYLSSFHPLPENGIELVRHFSEYPSWLYRVHRPVPRTFVASKIHVEVNAFKTLERLAAEGFESWREVIVERPMSVPIQKNFHGQAEITRYTNREVEIRANLSGDGVLVLGDAFYPGWRVYVDGHEREIFRANLFFRAVALSAGDHRVEFRYQPRSFAVGAAISGSTFLGAIASMVLLPALRRKQKKLNSFQNLTGTGK